MSGRKKFEAPEEGGPSWMDTYGDMVTLLLTFFVLLFSFSNIDAKKFEQLAQSLSGMTVVAVPALDPDAEDEPTLKGAGGFVITSATAEPTEIPDVSPEASFDNANVEVLKNKFDELYEKINTHIETRNLGYILNVEYTDEYTILLRMSDQAFFDSGSVSIDKKAKSALNEVCGILVEYTDLIKLIYIEGHTDNVPIHNGRYDDNWDLSYDRANTVRRFIVKTTELDPTLLAPTAYGEYHPIASNDTEEGKAKNRRVDFVIESKLKKD